MSESDKRYATVRFLGVWIAGSGKREVEIPLEHDTSVHEVLSAAVQALGLTQSAESLAETCMILVQGRKIVECEGWETMVQPGNRVSVVPLVGGGCVLGQPLQSDTVGICVGHSRINALG